MYVNIIYINTYTYTDLIEKRQPTSMYNVFYAYKMLEPNIVINFLIALLS